MTGIKTWTVTRDPISPAWSTAPVPVVTDWPHDFDLLDLQMTVTSDLLTSNDRDPWPVDLKWPSSLTSWPQMIVTSDLLTSNDRDLFDLKWPWTLTCWTLNTLNVDPLTSNDRDFLPVWPQMTVTSDLLNSNARDLLTCWPQMNPELWPVVLKWTLNFDLLTSKKANTVRLRLGQPLCQVWTCRIPRVRGRRTSGHQVSFPGLVTWNEIRKTLILLLILFLFTTWSVLPLVSCVSVLSVCLSVYLFIFWNRIIYSFFLTYKKKWNLSPRSRRVIVFAPDCLVWAGWLVL